MPLDPKTADLMLSDWEGWEKTLNDGQRQELESMLRFEPDREAAKKRFAGVAYVAASTGADVEEVSRRFEDWYLPAFAIDETVGLGRKEPVKDAAQLFDLLKERATTRRQREQTLKDDRFDALEAARRGDSPIVALQTWQLAKGKDRLEDSTPFTQAFLAADERLRGKRPLADSLFKSIEANLEMRGAGNAGAAAASSAGIDAAISRLADMTPEERGDVYSMIAAKGRAAGWEEKGMFGQMWSFLRRGTNRAFSTVGDTVSFLGGTISKALPEEIRPETADPEAMAKREREGEVYQELADLANGTLDPVRPSIGWMPDLVERGLIQGPGAVLPFMAASATMSPMGAATLFTADFAEQNRRNLRKQGMSQQAARNIGLAAAPFQAAVEQLSNAFQLGKLPGVQRFLAGFTKPVQGFPPLRYAGNVALSTLSEFTEEQLQDNFIVPAVQEVFDLLGQDVPEVDWSMYRTKAVAETPELLATLIPMALVFGGIMTAADVQNSSALVEDRNVLEAAGYSTEQADVIMAAPDRIEKARELWTQRDGTPVSIEAALETAAAAQKEENQRKLVERAEFEQALSDAVDAGLIPTIRRDAQGWAVEKDGALVRVSTREEAVGMAYAALNDQERQAAEATAQLADEFMDLGGGRAEAFEISRQNATTETEVEAGRVTPEQARRAVELYGQMHGLTAEEASAEVGRVLGNNRMEMVEGVRTAVSRIFGGGNVLTALHEGVHGRWNAGLERGHYTHAMGVEWVRMAERAAGWQFLPTRDDAAVTPAMLDEAIVEVAQADLLGRRKDGKQHFSPGLISRGVASFALAGRAEAKQAGKLAAFLKAWREFWGQVLRAGRAMRKARAEGKLGEDFDVLLDDLLGTEPQQRFEAQAAREAAEMAASVDPDNVPFSLAPSNLAQAEQHLRALAGKPMTTADGLTATVSGVTAAKMASASAVRKSVSPAAHLAAIGAFEELYQRGRITESKPDRDADVNIAAIHRVESPMEFGGRRLNVRFTVKELVNPPGNRIYSIESMDLEGAPPAGLLDNDAAQATERRSPLTGGTQQEDAQPGGGSQAAFSLAPRSLASVADTVLAAQMRKPEFREKYLELARQRLAKLRQDGEWQVDKAGRASKREGTDSQAARIRTPANIEAERKWRQRQRQRELIDAGMAGLTPDTLAAYEQGLTNVETHPLLVAMLDGQGKLMSRTTAQRLGKLKTDGQGNAGDYDGAPWLPPKWYAKGTGGMMPDRMAQALHEDGLLRDAYPDTLWEALRSVIESTRGQNEKVRQAVEAVRAIERKAAEQSRAEAEAWAKEERAKVPSAKDRQMAALRTLDVILSAFPPEVRGRVGGFVKLASLGTDKAREAEIMRRLDKLDEVVEDAARKHYAEAIEKLFERAKPKREAGKKPQGKLGPDVQRLVDLALTFSKLTEAEVGAERAAIAARMETATGPAVVDLLEREQVLDLFGAIDQRTAAEMEAAHDWLAAIYAAGRNRWRAVIEARAQEAEDRRAEARKDIGKAGTDAEIQAQLAQAKKLKAQAGGASYAMLSFEQVVQAVLGRGSKLGRDLVRAARVATNAKTDAMRAKRRDFRAAMSGIFGTTRQLEWQKRLFDLSQIDSPRAVSVLKLEGARIEERAVPVEIVERIIAGEAIAKAYGLDALAVDVLEAAWSANEALPANRRKSALTYSVPVAGKPTPTRLSQLQAVHVTMLERQPSYAENMAGHGWTAEVMQEIEAQLTPEAKAIRAFLADQYRGGYDPLNAVYSRMYGVNLPRLTNYAPGTFEARDMMGAEMDPYGQGLLSEGGFRAGMLKTRAQHRARPRLDDDALAVYWGHVNATEHFKAFGEFARDVRAVLNEASVRASIKAKGVSALEAVQAWINAFERNGVEQAKGIAWLNKLALSKQSSRAWLSLAYNAATIAKQSTAALGALLNMGPTAAARQLARLLAGQLELGASYRSAVIQRRLDAGYSPEVRQAMAGAMAEKPTWASPFVQKGMEILGVADAIFTTASHAMAWDYHFNEAKAGGLTEAQARQVADLEAEATVARTAQPAEMMDRSIFELGLSPAAKFGFMFMTEARQKAALIWEAYAPNSGLSKGERATRVLLLHVVFPVMLQTISNVWRDARDDGEDDEVFDEKNWKAADYIRAMLLGPLTGVPLVASALDAYRSDSWWSQFTGGITDIFEAIEEGDMDKGLKAAKATINAGALAVGGERAAAAGIIARGLHDLYRIGGNITDDD